MFKTRKISIPIIILFLLFPSVIRGAGAVQSAPNSKIYLMTQGEEDDITLNNNYSWTFTSAEIDVNKVVVAPNALKLNKYKYAVSSSNPTGENYICAYPNKNGKRFYCQYYLGYQENSATFIVPEKKNQYKGDIYIYYPYIGSYNGKSVGLKISLIDYKLFEDNKIVNNVEVPTISFLKDKPTIAMYGLNSVDLKYEFYDSKCYNTSSTFNGCKFDEVNHEKIKGYGTLIDIDALQSVKLSNGIDRAYIYSNYDYVCGEYDVQKDTYTHKDTYAHNTLSTCKKELGNSVYKGNQYAYLIPNYLPREVIGGSSYDTNVTCSGVQKILKSGIRINNDNQWYSGNASGKEIRTCFEKNEETLNAISSAPVNTIDDNKYAWATILYSGSFELTYYFNGDYTSLTSSNSNGTIDNIELRYAGGGGGEFTFTPNTIFPIYKLADLKYRVIDKKYPFLDMKGNLRNTGRNWCAIDSCNSNNSKVQKYITKRPDSNGLINVGNVDKKTKPLYSFTLTPDNIRKIRQYNEYKTYDDFNKNFINSLLTSNAYATFNSRDSLCKKSNCDINKTIDKLIEESE